MALLERTAAPAVQAPAKAAERASAGDILRTVIIAAALLMFFLPLVATAIFGFSLPGQGFTLDPLREALAGTTIGAQLLNTLNLAMLSTAGSLVLLVPTLLFLHLKAPGLLRFTEWLSVVPYVVPGIALVAGANLFFRAVAPGFMVSLYSLVPFYMVLTLPLVYRSLDAGIRALDLRTLWAASESLGAKPWQSIVHVVLPNLRGALLGASLLSCAMVLGEYAIAALLLHSTFPVFMVQVGMNEPRAAAALSFLTILATWLLLAVLARSGSGKTTAKGGSR
ncbi:permease [Glutamicibacter uratoxydans]|uniref:Permease n=1 Tax=Glutamicibacter uratoxydans TaxID=43667 RepID=A0A4Y4DIU9_GLUUR|nr:ABC transporter permease subunit [Glutamicibacter uratoxydans]GED05182.1 permease [Glutamicibacter uratoxydans]